MAEQLGRAVLDLDANLAPLDAKLDRAKARIAQFVATEQAILDSLHADVNVNVHGGEGAAAGAAGTRAAAATPAPVASGGGARGPTQNEIQRGGLWGVRGPEQAGSIRNPVVMVLESSKYVPMGSYAAAIGAADSTDAQRQGGGSMLAQVAALQGLRSSLEDLAQNMTPAARLSQQGEAGIATPPSVATASSSSDQATAAALQQAADALSKLHGDMTTAERRAVAAPHPSVTQASSRGSFAPARSSTSSTSTHPQGPVVIDSQRTIIEDRAGSGSSAFGAAAGPAGSSGAAGSPGVAAGAGGRGSGGGPPVAVGGPGSGGGGGGRGINPDFFLRSGGGSGGSGDNGLRNLLFGGGEGPSHLPFPLNMLFGHTAGFGSLGSLAGFGSEHFLLTLLGLGASATSAVGGAGLLGAGGLTQSAVGGGADALVNKATLDQVKNYATAVQSLRTAVADYGAQSQQAKTAQASLNQAIAQMGGGPAAQAEQQVAKNAQALKQLFLDDSNAARAQSADMMDQVLHLGTVYTPLVTAAAQRNLQIINTGLKPLFSWLEGPQGIQIFDDLENHFAKGLPTGIHAFDQGMELFLRIMNLAAQDTGGLTQHLDAFFTRLNGEDNVQLGDRVSRLVGDFRLWDQFVVALIRDLRLMFSADSGTAQSIVVTLTQMLDKLGAWEQSTKGQAQLQNLFTVHKQEMLDLLHLLPVLTSGFGSVYMDLAPPIVEAMNAILPLLKDVLGLIGDIAKSSPLAGTAIGLLLVSMKAFGAGTTLNAIRSGFGLLTGSERTNTGAANADAAANARLAGAERAAGSSGAAGGAEREAGGMTSAEAAAGGGAAGLGARAGRAVEGGALKVGGALESAGAGGAGMAVVSGGASLGPTIAAAIPLVIPATIAAVAASALLNHFGTPDSRAPRLGGPGSSVRTASGQPVLNPRVAPFSSPTGTRGAATTTIMPGVTETGGIVQIQNLGKASQGSAKQVQALIDALKHANGVKVSGISANVDALLGSLRKVEAEKTRWNAAFDQAWAGVNRFFRNTSHGLSSLKDDFASNMRLIEHTLGTESNAGRQLVADNVQKMISAVTQGMLNGKISVTSGMAAIKQALQQGMQDGATSWTTAWHSMFSTVTDLYQKHKIDTKQYLSEVRSIMAEGDQHIRQDTQASYQQMFAYLKGQQDNGVITHQQFENKIHAAQVAANEQAKTDMQDFAAQIVGGFASVTAQGGKGLKDLISSVNSALKLLGQAPLTGLQISVIGSNAFESNQPVDKHHGAAQGMLMQIGKPGQAGRDSVPMRVAGQDIVVAPGEVAAVFTRHQYQEANTELAHRGGLPGIFQNRTPNYMASGGFVADPGTNFTVGQEPQIAARLNELARALGVTIYGISGYRSPQHSVAVGGFADDPHTKGEAADIGVNSQSRPSAAQLSNAELAKFGLYRPFDPSDDPGNTEVNHIQLLGSAVGKAVANIAASATSAAASAAVQQIQAPNVKGKGPLAKITQAALDKTTKAANKLLASKTPAAGTPGGSLLSGPVSSAGIHSGTWFQVASQIAKRHGWSPQEVQDWYGVEQLEDGSLSLTAKNPTSDAYGLAQFINGPSEYAQYGGDSSTIVGQLTGMANYIAQRYGSPSAALAYEHAHHSYATGGVVEGPVSTFGPPTDPSGQTAYGRSDSQPGLSLRMPGSHYSDPVNRSMMGKFFDLMIGGHTGRFIDFDLGPADWTGKNIDVTGAAARMMGINPEQFPTGAFGRATPVSKLTAKQQAFANAHKTSTGKKAPKPTGNKGLAGSTFASSDLNKTLLGNGGPLPFSGADLTPFNGALEHILALDGGGSGLGPGSTGDATKMSDLINFYTNLWGTSLYPTPNFSSWQSPSDFVISQDAAGNPITPYISPNINEVLKQLSQVTGYQGKWVGDLQGSLGLSKHLETAIRKAIKRRVDEIARIRKRIEANVRKIKTLRGNVKAESGKTHQTAAAHKQSQVKIGAWNSQIQQLESENQQLAGKKDSVGGKGELGQIAGQLGAAATDSGALAAVEGTGSSATGLYQLLSTVQGWETQLGGTTGDIANQKLQLSLYRQGLASLMPGADQALAATVASSSTSSASNSDAQLVSLLEQQLQAAGEALAVQTAQFGVLSNLPPFGGSFATGGMVPGPVGAARTVIAHGGEVITPVGRGGGSPEVHVHVDRKSDLAKLIDVRIEQRDRTTARHAGRGLPGRGGGLLTPTR